MPDLFWPGDERAGALFTDVALLEAMVSVEQAWLDALRSSVTPAAGGETVMAGLIGPDDVEALAHGAEGGGNPVLGLVRLLRERSADPWVHRGLTSQDVLDTALMLCLRDTVEAVRSQLSSQVGALVALTEAHRGTVMAGRTLGQHAVPITFGLKAATWLTGVLDARDALAALRFPVQLGGAAGTLSATELLVGTVVTDPGLGSAGADGSGGADRSDAPGASDGADGSAGPGPSTGPSEPRTPQANADHTAARTATVLTDTATRLGLESRPPWHTSRRPFTAIGDALVACTDAWAKIATDVVTLSRTEIGEVAEPAGEGRGGSSTMPHKRNPVLSVLIRRAALTAPALGSTLHLAAALSSDERPDGAWHAEWATLRDLGRRTVVAASQTTELLGGLEVDAARMAATVEAHRGDLLAERASISRFLDPGDAPAPARSSPASGTDGPAASRSAASPSPETTPGSGFTAAPSTEPDHEPNDPSSEPTAESSTPSAYLGMTDHLIDQVLERARTSGGSQ